MSLYLGIDPGLTGALAWVEAPPDGNPRIVHVEDMPVGAKAHGKGNAVNAHALVELILAKRPAIAVIERVQATPPIRTPGQPPRTAGAQSSFTFGYGAGVVEGALAALNISTMFVLPHVWKRGVGLIGKPKDASRLLVTQRFPEAGKWLLRKKDAGRADAILMAVYGPGLWNGTGIGGLLS